MPDHSFDLMERDNAGLAVTLKRLPSSGTIVLTVQTADGAALVRVDPARALDAFYHPTVYLSDAQVARILPRP